MTITITIIESNLKDSKQSFFFVFLSVCIVENACVVGGKCCVMLLCKNTLNNYSGNVKTIHDLIYIGFSKKFFISKTKTRI